MNMTAKTKNKVLAIFDIETDPFMFGYKPKAFLIGLFDGKKMVQFWGDDCIKKFCEYLLLTQTTYCLFAHNGGKFDFFFLPWPIDSPKIIGSRIVKAKIGKHELRDSYAILPMPLADYKKTEIDYNKFKKENREKHKEEIMAYHRDDLKDTYKLVSEFENRFGRNLTIASTALKQLIALHPVEKKSRSHDEKFRQFLFGGRVEVFKQGRTKGKIKAYDVNSMYPYV